ncbi:TonB-dependent receptor family protein [Geoalkalibacter sp.]|uniref:TonB-dependent receptor family protein n=1 Tax=Geoalkalibacter sp. TaxID=3041440 RepID=UPI00272DF176|nr:TonB-dependent siderophore receptor [Geoalkalibacter sp.]
MKSIRTTKKLAFPMLLGVSLLATSVAHAEPETTARLPRIDIIGSAAEALERTPGSATVITQEKLEATRPLSTQDALRREPGIHAVETDGYGFFPRIGVRGLNPDMSKKVMLLEDGAPIALGPYTDPAAYYHPPIERMERIEVLKGSGSLRYGPSTIGGAINYVTKNPPYQPGGALTLTGGNQGFRSLLFDYGGTWDNVAAGISYLKKAGDGNRQNNDFDVDDLVLKTGFGIGANQFVGVKLTYYNNDSQSTYLGLTQREFEENPRQNKAAQDRLEVERYSLDLNHELQITPDLTWRTLLYANNAVRDWWREDFRFNADTGLNEMRGTNGGRLREFTLAGVDTRLEFNHETLGIRNETDFGVRLHTEEMTNQRVNGATADARSGVIREDDLREADALAVFLQNRFHLTERLALTPGLRVESYRQKRAIHRWDSADVNASNKTSNTEWVPGIGATYKLSDALVLFGGIHRGFAPPRVADAVANDGDAIDLKAERSNNYEAGVRGRLPRLSYEVTAFRYDFSNQIIQASQAGGATSELTNAGKTINQGFEVGIGADLGWGFGLDANWTHVPTAKLDSTRILGGIDRKGNRLPYAPENLVNATLSYRQGPWGTGLQYQFVDQQFADFENTRVGSANGRTGILPSYSLWHLNGDYQVTERIQVFASVKNLFDKKYIASRAPEGIFPGLERLISAGVKMNF